MGVAISGTVPDGEGVAASLPLQYGAHRPWVHTVGAEVILHLLRHADCERTLGVPAGVAKLVNQMPLWWPQDGLCARGRHAGHPFRYVRAASHHSDTLLHKANWAASQDIVLQNTPPDPGHAQLIVAGRDGHLEVAQRAQTDHALTHRGHTPLGAAHATAYVHARDLTATAINRRALRARDSQTARLRVCKERLSGVAVNPQPCLLCTGGDPGAHARGVRPLTVPLAPLPPGGTRGGPPSPTRGQSPVGGRGAPQAPHGRKSSAPDWCPRTRRRSSVP